MSFIVTGLPFDISRTSQLLLYNNTSGRRINSCRAHGDVNHTFGSQTLVAGVCRVGPCLILRSSRGLSAISFATQLCQRLNNPVKNEHGNSAKAILTMVRFDRDLNGTLNMDSETFLDVFDDFGFHPYWLHLIFHSVYGHFSLWRENGTLYTSYFNTASSTLLWSHDLSTLSTKVVIISRLPPAYNDFLRSVHNHKDMIDDWRFCSLVCSIQTIHWVERSVGDHLKAVRIIESETGYGVWHTSEGAKDRKDTQLLVKISEKTGSILTELSNIARHASIARSVLNDLSQPRNPPSSQHSIALSSAVNVPTSQAPISFVNQTIRLAIPTKRWLCPLRTRCPA
jgi:hypothetical protein